MHTPNPLDAVLGLIAAIEQGDPVAAVAFYEPEASFVVQPGRVVHGIQAISEALAGFHALKPTITTETYQIIQADDIAFCCSRWNLQGTAPDGSPVQVGGTSTDVLRRQADGNWLIAIDNPWGTAILG